MQFGYDQVLPKWILLNALNRTRYKQKGRRYTMLLYWALNFLLIQYVGPKPVRAQLSTIYRRYGKPYSVILLLPLHNKTAPPLPVDVANLLVNHVNLLSCFSRLYFVVIYQIPHNRSVCYLIVDSFAAFQESDNCFPECYRRMQCHERLHLNRKMDTQKYKRRWQ